jgi:hypothetical protein
MSEDRFAAVMKTALCYWSDGNECYQRAFQLPCSASLDCGRRGTAGMTTNRSKCHDPDDRRERGAHARPDAGDRGAEGRPLLIAPARVGSTPHGPNIVERNPLFRLPSRSRSREWRAGLAGYTGERGVSS